MFFDIVFMDPPYNNELERQVLEYLKDSTVVDENTLIIVEADLQTDFSYVESLGYRQLRSKNTCLFVLYSFERSCL